MTADWTPTDRRLPERGQRVDWISPGGEQVDGGTFAGGAVWLLPGGGMYVYYRPTFWRPAACPIAFPVSGTSPPA
jgi:hypothetical protein